MSAPSEEDLNSWVHFPQYYVLDKERKTVRLTDDAPPEVVRSFNEDG